MIYKAFLDEIRQTEDGEEYLARLQKAYNRLRFRKFESHVDEKLFRKFYELKDKWTSSDFLENFRNNGALDENNTIILDDVRIEAFEVPTGAECRAWTILPNTNRLLEKNEADNLEEWTEKNAQIVLHNNVVVSEIATRFFDIESAEYYFASSVERTKVVTPSFLKDDESLVSERSIIGYHTYDFDYIIERVKDYLSLRKIEKGEIDAITFENIKQNIFKRFILCQDQHCENSGLIVDNPESP
ncbi:MAG: hypothetical protein FWC68_04705, partial [Oscillospiraceae bacterium]|nr:hypothetical protein [Oscillospiraceae bacterium]